jgi:hypothetical protein
VPWGKTHDHKDIKQLVENVTHNTSIRRISKNTRIKSTAQKQDCLRKKSSPIKILQKPKQILAELGELSFKVSIYYVIMETKKWQH